MGTQSVTYALELSQEQLQAFVEFMRLGDELSRLLFQYSSSFTYGVVDVMLWNKAYSAVFYIYAAGTIFGRLSKCNLLLSFEHVTGLRDLLAIANKFQRSFLQLPLKERITQNESLFLRFTSVQGMFYDKIRNLVVDVYF